MKKIDKTFYEYYLQQNRLKDIQNQKECVSAAEAIKSFLLKETNSLAKKHNWLLEKINKNIRDNYRGQLIEKEVLGIIDEIIDKNNSSSKLYWCKSPRKQKIEELQRNFIFETHNIEILAGKTHGVCASGENSFRFIYETAELKKGLNKKEGLTTKSMDGIIISNDIKSDGKCWIFQKVTTDDGGSTNSVEEEVIKTINVAKKHTTTFETKDIFIFLLDGPYWERKQYKKDTETRFDKIYKISSDKVVVCNSNTIKEELRKRNLIF
jgi:hypothetical protein